MENGKYLRAALQLMMKQGPAYDRWKAAMDTRGEQKRCGDCLAFNPNEPEPPYNFCGFKGREVNSGRFACKMFLPFTRS